MGDATRQDVESVGLSASESQPYAQAAQLLATGPAVDAPSQFGILSRLARRITSRVGRHWLLYLRSVDQALLASIAEERTEFHKKIADLQGVVSDLTEERLRAEERTGVLEASVAALTAAHLDGSVAANGADDSRSPESLVSHVRARLAKRFDPSVPIQVSPRLPAAIRLDTDVGPMLFPAEDQVMTPIIRSQGYWEKEESAELRSILRSGMTFVDIGAHVGYLTMLAAGAVGRSGRGFAIEASPENFALLRTNLAWRGVTQVEALHAAAWDETGHVTLTLSEDNTGDDRAQGHGVAADAFEEAEPFPGRTARTESVEVLAVALDDVIPVDLNIDVVKVDIQGADHIAIRGMERTLVNSHPTVLVEFWPEGIRELGDEPVDVLQYYARLGYDIRLLGEPAHTGKLALGAIVENAFTNEHRYATLVLTPKTP